MLKYWAYMWISSNASMSIGLFLTIALYGDAYVSYQGALIGFNTTNLSESWYSWLLLKKEHSNTQKYTVPLVNYQLYIQ